MGWARLISPPEHKADPWDSSSIFLVGGATSVGLLRSDEVASPKFSFEQPQLGT